MLCVIYGIVLGLISGLIFVFLKIPVVFNAKQAINTVIIVINKLLTMIESPMMADPDDRLPDTKNKIPMIGIFGGMQTTGGPKSKISAAIYKKVKPEGIQVFYSCHLYCLSCCIF